MTVVVVVVVVPACSVCSTGGRRGRKRAREKREETATLRRVGLVLFWNTQADSVARACSAALSALKGASWGALVDTSFKKINNDEFSSLERKHLLILKLGKQILLRLIEM